ncbi:hypothetical protein LJC59_03570 [Desulfovibrio sp. OttesenSCG-928-A18]|nr:hypothetical protein [Desulfovibrio sp. OttesenSCG-928-A18]
MNKTAIIEKLEGMAASLREQLDKNEGSSLSAIAGGISSLLESAKALVLGNDKARKLLEKLKEQMARFEKAVREGDKKVSASALDYFEKTLKDMKRKSAEEREPKSLEGKSDE